MKKLEDNKDNKELCISHQGCIKDKDIPYIEEIEDDVNNFNCKDCIYLKK